MVDRPILFSAPMVRALLAGTKTQTRRVCNPQPLDIVGQRHRRLYRDEDYKKAWQHPRGCNSTSDPYVDSHYGAPGDRLWVRETWRTGKNLDDLSPKKIAAKCLEAGWKTPWAPIQLVADGAITCQDDLEAFGGWGKKRVSIHMPRWASRITLDMTGVRAERLQEISKEDAKAEGVGADEILGAIGASGRNAKQWPEDAGVGGYRFLWESINGPGSWDANPWVWVIDFKRVVP